MASAFPSFLTAQLTYAAGGRNQLSQIELEESFYQRDFPVRMGEISPGEEAFIIRRSLDQNLASRLHEMNYGATAHGLRKMHTGTRWTASRNLPNWYYLGKGESAQPNPITEQRVDYFRN